MAVIVRQFQKHDMIHNVSSFILLLMLIVTAVTFPLIIQDMFIKWRLEQNDLNEFDTDGSLLKNDDQFSLNQFTPLENEENLVKSRIEGENIGNHHKVVKRIIEDEMPKQDANICSNHKSQTTTPHNRVHHKNLIIVSKQGAQEIPRIRLERKALNHIEPKVSNHFEPKVSNHFEPKVSNHFEPKVSNHFEPKVSNHFEPKVSNHFEPKVSNHFKPEVTEETTRTNHGSRFDWLFRKPKTTEKSILNVFHKPTVLTATMNNEGNRTEVKESSRLTNMLKREVKMEKKEDDDGEEEKEEGKEEEKNVEGGGEGLFDFFENCVGSIVESLFPFVTETPDTNQQEKSDFFTDEENDLDDIFPPFPPFFPMENLMGSGWGDETPRDEFEKKMEDLWSHGEGDVVRMF